jgi:hypothetical protein
MPVTFTTTLFKDDGSNATGIEVPEEVITALGPGKKPKVKVTVNGFTYRSTVAVFGGAYFLPVSAERRQAAGIHGGDPIEVTLELDTEPRTVDVPEDLTEALQERGLLEAFQGLSHTRRQEYVRQVETAKAPETRTRRIQRVLQALSETRKP